MFDHDREGCGFNFYSGEKLFTFPRSEMTKTKRGMEFCHSTGKAKKFSGKWMKCLITNFPLTTSVTNYIVKSTKNNSTICNF